MGDQAGDVRNFWTVERLARLHAAMDEGMNLKQCIAWVNRGVPDNERANRSVVAGMLRRQRAARTDHAKVWSAEAKRMIGEAYRDGMSAADVAKLYSGKLDGGRKLTRNTVLGMANRGGYTRPPSAAKASRTSGVAKVAANRSRASKMGAGVPAVPSRPVRSDKPMPPVNISDYDRPVPVEAPLMIALSSRCGCAYPMGNNGADTLFCGRAVDTTTRQKQYCSTHHMAMFRPNLKPVREYMPRSRAHRPADSRLFGGWA